MPPGLARLVHESVGPVLDGTHNFLAEKGEFELSDAAGADQQGPPRSVSRRWSCWVRDPGERRRCLAASAQAPPP